MLLHFQNIEPALHRSPIDSFPGARDMHLVFHAPCSSFGPEIDTNGDRGSFFFASGKCPVLDLPGSLQVLNSTIVRKLVDLRVIGLFIKNLEYSVVCDEYLCRHLFQIPPSLPISDLTVQTEITVSMDVKTSHMCLRCPDVLMS